MVEIDEKLGIDERDKIILDIIGQNPQISQAEIGQKIKLSQPSVGARIQKLKDKGVLSVIAGVNYKKVDLYLAKVEVSATDTNKVLESFDKCPFFINGLVMSGVFNLTIFLTAPSIEELEEVVNYHLRTHDNVTNVRMDLVIKPIKNFVLPVSFDITHCKDKKNFQHKCKVCPVREKVFT